MAARILDITEFWLTQWDSVNLYLCLKWIENGSTSKLSVLADLELPAEWYQNVEQLCAYEEWWGAQESGGLMGTIRNHNQQIICHATSSHRQFEENEWPAHTRIFLEQNWKIVCGPFFPKGTNYQFGGCGIRENGLNVIEMGEEKYYWEHAAYLCTISYRSSHSFWHTSSFLWLSIW